MTIGIWTIGGLLALVGAVCFAELTTRFPNQVGGDYVYLKAAYGKPVAFMFAWTAFWIIRPGNICIMALVFAEYFGKAAEGLIGEQSIWVAVAVIAILSGVNLSGIRPGIRTQNTLTIAKLAGIACVIAVPVLPEWFGTTAAALPVSPETAASSHAPGSLMLGIVFVMFTMSGWNDLALVAGEIKRPEVNLHRALVCATATVTLIYLIFNIALYTGLGYQGMSESSTVATDLVLSTANRLGDSPLADFLRRFGYRLVAALVCVSCLGAINGMIITSPRIYYSVGLDFRAFAFLAKWDRQRGVPWQAVLVQSAVTIVLILVTLGRPNGVEEVVTATTPFFYSFFACSVFTIFIFRWREMHTDNKKIQHVPLYPLPPIVFLGVCAMICYSSVNYIVYRQLLTLTLVLGGLMLAGIVVALATRSNGSR